jgi:hypothetical protein
LIRYSFQTEWFGQLLRWCFVLVLTSFIRGSFLSWSFRWLPLHSWNL